MIVKFLIIFLIFGLAGGIDIPGIIKQKKWRELAAYSVFLILGITVTVMYQVFKISFVSVTDWFIENLSLLY